MRRKRIPFRAAISAMFMTFMAGQLFVCTSSAQEEFVTVRGNITWRGAGTPFVLNPRVQVMDPKSGKAMKVLTSTRGDNGGDYEIENVAVGSYDVAICDDRLRVQPKLEHVTVQQGKTRLDFKVEKRAELSGLELAFANWKAIYLKHLETGCELGPYLNNEGKFTIKNISGALLGLEKPVEAAEYAFCVDNVQEPESDPQPFESCVRRHVNIGVPIERVLSEFMIEPEKIKNEIYTFRYAKITVVSGKVSAFAVGLNQPDSK